MSNSTDLCIRLARILPQSHIITRRDSRSSQDYKNPIDLVECGVFSTPLASAPPYKALSYAWGNLDIVEPILLQGRLIKVTTNLEAALRHLATTIREPLTIWIDSICINQEDEKEKTEQVGRMRDIFSQAEEVIAWLGRSEDPDGARWALRWMKEWGSKAVDLGIGSTPEMMLRRVLVRTESCTNIIDGIEEREFATSLMKELSSHANPRYDSLITALQDFMDRPYWSRIWVVQEVQMAARVTFVCPEGVLEPDALNAALRILRNFRHWQLMKRGSGKQAHLVNSSFSDPVLETNPSHALNLLKLTRTGGYGMVSLLRHSRMCKATDPRDRIFALLGASIHAERLGLEPDYSLTCEQVYTDVARRLLQRGHFELLESCTHTVDRADSKLNLPSWVPDWTIPPTRSALQERGYPGAQGDSSNRLQPEFRASGARVSAEIEVLSWNDPLILSAIAIGQVCLVGDASKERGTSHWLQTIHDLAQATACRYSYSAGTTEAVWRTAVADQLVRNGKYKPRLREDEVERLKACFSNRTYSSLQPKDFVDNDMGLYAEQLNNFSRNRRPFVLSSGHLCVGPEEVAVGDRVFLFLGASVPYVLRSRDDDSFVFVGSVYVHECMDGEAAGDDAVVQVIEIH